MEKFIIFNTMNALQAASKFNALTLAHAPNPKTTLQELQAHPCNLPTADAQNRP